jgi:hypothetical protein
LHDLSQTSKPRYRRRERLASKAWIDTIFEGNSKVHKKQRHTAHRIFERLQDEQGFTGPEFLSGSRKTTRQPQAWSHELG